VKCGYPGYRSFAYSVASHGASFSSFSLVPPGKIPNSVGDTLILGQDPVIIFLFLSELFEAPVKDECYEKLRAVWLLLGEIARDGLGRLHRRSLVARGEVVEKLKAPRVGQLDEGRENLISLVLDICGNSSSKSHADNAKCVA
jgi:hypothetical protein